LIEGVRGNQELKEGITYFEVLVKEPLYGTAVMIGVGTSDVHLHYSDFEYVNLVGKDENSWGLCHKGSIWHNNKSTSYCSPFFHKDTIVGVLYDSYKHKLHFFVNHVYMGVAFE
jgi:SPRY domain-containing SOCS box protein 3